MKLIVALEVEELGILKICPTFQQQSDCTKLFVGIRRIDGTAKAKISSTHFIDVSAILQK